MSWRGPTGGRRQHARGAAISGGDPFFSSVVLLCLQEEGANGTNVFIDQSSVGRALTTVGNAVWDNVVAPPTGLLTTGKFDGVGDSITAADAADLEPGAGDFTIELWANPTNNVGARTLICKSSSVSSFGPWLIQRQGANWTYYLSSAGIAWDISSNTLMGASTAGAWQHLAISRTGTTFTPFVAGVAGTSKVSALGLIDNAFPVCIGSLQLGFGQDFAGNIAAVRYTIGVGRYTANFTPPSLPQPTS